LRPAEGLWAFSSSRFTSEFFQWSAVGLENQYAFFVKNAKPLPGCDRFMAALCKLVRRRRCRMATVLPGNWWTPNLQAIEW
jgi:hypothetical protein